MRTAVVIGGGPGGLFCAILLKLALPTASVRVIERNRPDETFGFGVAFHKATLHTIEQADPVFLASLMEILHPWDDAAFHLRGRQFRLSRHGFAGCSRHRLLRLLQERAAGLGVQLDYGQVTDASAHANADLVVVADGSSSRNRTAMASAIGPSVVARPNRFVWLGTERPMAEMNFFFREHAGGLFVAHAYPHAADQGTWIVETDERSFFAAGLDNAEEPATGKLMEEVFADDLQGYPLIVRGSFWRQFPLIHCARWTSGNVALLGDAKATAHYSIGSGTKIAMEDAVALVASVVASADVESALTRYEAVRRPEVEALQSIAFGSMLWFESLAAHWPMDPAQIAMGGLTRKTDETFRAISERAPDLASSALRAYLGRESAADESPLAVPLDLGDHGDIALSGRRVVRLAAGAAVPVAGDPGAALVVSATVDLGQLAASDVVARLLAAGGDCRALVLRNRVAPAAQPTSASESDRAALRRAAASGIELLLIEIDDAARIGEDEDEAGASDGAVTDDQAAAVLRGYSTLADAWPGPVGIRIHPRAEPSTALPLLARIVALGARLVAVAPAGAGVAHQAVVSDMVRNYLGVAVFCEGVASIEEAETALIAGRADLVSIA